MSTANATITSIYAPNGTYMRPFIPNYTSRQGSAYLVGYRNNVATEWNSHGNYWYMDITFTIPAGRQVTGLTFNFSYSTVVDQSSQNVDFWTFGAYSLNDSSLIYPGLASGNDWKQFSTYYSTSIGISSSDRSLSLRVEPYNYGTNYFTAYCIDTVSISYTYLQTYTYSFYKDGSLVSSKTKTEGSSTTTASAVSKNSTVAQYASTITYTDSSGYATPPSSYTFPNNIMNNYSFSVWNNSTYGNYGADASINIDANLTFNAVFTTSTSGNTSITLPSISTGYSYGTSTVYYNGNGGVASIDSNTGTITYRYTINNWGYSGGTFAVGAKYYNSYGSVTLNVNWNAATLVSYGSVTLPTATRTNYSFIGWNSDSSATTGQTGTYYPQAVSTTLYAIWKSIIARIYIMNSSSWTEYALYTLSNSSWTPVTSFNILSNSSWNPSVQV